MIVVSNVRPMLPGMQITILGKMYRAIEGAILAPGDWYYHPFTSTIEEYENVDYGHFDPNVFNVLKLVEIHPTNKE